MKGRAMAISAQECCGAIAAVEFVQNGEFISSVATCERCGYVEMWEEALSVADWELIRDDVMAWTAPPEWRHPDDYDGPEDFARALARHDETTRDSIILREIHPGRGRHTCTDACKDPCYSMCDDSDVIVTLDYGTRGYGADYAMLNGRAVLWAN